MFIKAEHFVKKYTGFVDAEQTLSNVFNAFIGSLYPGLKITKFGFKLTTDATLFSFRIKVEYQNPETLSDNLAILSDLLGFTDARISIVRDQQVIKIHIDDHKRVTQLFDKIDYQSILTDMAVPSSRRVDLLQLLMADVIRDLIFVKRITPHMPKDVEFDYLGNLSMTVTSPNDVAFRLETTEEVVSFIKKYCKVHVPASFSALLRAQMIHNMGRFIRYLEKSNMDLIPNIFAENKLSSLKLIESKKMLSCSIERRDGMGQPISQPERRLFKIFLERMLGNRFAVRWRSLGEEYQLILSSASDIAFTEVEVDHLSATLLRNKLLTKDELAAVEIQKLAGVAIGASYAMSQEIEDILCCKITYCLPTHALITPDGNTFEEEAIRKHLDSAFSNKFDPLSRSPLLEYQLRPNLIIAKLMAHFTECSVGDPNITPPSCLLNAVTGDFYQHPVVNMYGETIEGRKGEYYSNRVVSELIAYYKSELRLIEQPVTRSKVRETIGANIGMLCPGVGVLTRDEALDETEMSLPYPDFDSLSDTLHIYFISKEYARRLEVGLRGWTLSGRHFPEGHVQLESLACEKSIEAFDGTLRTIRFQARLSIVSDATSRLLLETLCGLSQEYFPLLKEISLSGTQDVFNHLMQTIPLGNWSRVPRRGVDDAASSAPNILSMRARSHSIRMAGTPSMFSQAPATLPFSNTTQDDASDEEARRFKRPKTSY